MRNEQINVDEAWHWHTGSAFEMEMDQLNAHAIEHLKACREARLYGIWSLFAQTQQSFNCLGIDSGLMRNRHSQHTWTERHELHGPAIFEIYFKTIWETHIPGSEWVCLSMISSRKCMGRANKRPCRLESMRFVINPFHAIKHITTIRSCRHCLDRIRGCSTLCGVKSIFGPIHTHNRFVREKK